MTRKQYHLVRYIKTDLEMAWNFSEDALSPRNVKFTLKLKRLLAMVQGDVTHIH
jgi:hypothetical protein